MFALIVFDLDGTLVDSRRDLADSANALLSTYDADPLPDETVVRMVGEGARTLVARILAAGRVDAAIDEALARFLALYDKRLTNHTRPYEGVQELLAALSGRRALAVLTNKPQRPTERLLAHFGMQRYFRAVVGGDTVHGRKPEPAGLLSICARTQATPGETLIVGDSWVDVETARRTGAQVCFADYGFGDEPAEGLRADAWRIAAPIELLRLLASTARSPAIKD
jgi:phosphoglycolate phosphatase